MFNKFSDIKKIFAEEKDILLAYIFGSQVIGKTGPLSDYDFAVFLSRKPSFQFKYKLKNKLVNILNAEQVDLVILNDAPIELKYKGIEQRLERLKKCLIKLEPLKEKSKEEFFRDEYLQDIVERNLEVAIPEKLVN